MSRNKKLLALAVIIVIASLYIFRGKECTDCQGYGLLPQEEAAMYNDSIMDAQADSLK